MTKDWMITRRALLVSASLTALPKILSAGSNDVRVALVIGNTEYDWTTPLDNAAKDALKIKACLQRLGFQVSFYRDLDLDGFQKALRDFEERVSQLAPGVITFFYYSGHGAQDLAQTNYLIPVDAKVEGPEELRESAVRLGDFYESLNRANNDVNIIVLDACRNWFPEDISVEVRRGLHDIGRQGNMWIAMAASPGSVVSDGSGDGSPYSRRLIEALGQGAREPLVLLFDDVQGKVNADTEGAQSPESINALSRAPRFVLAQDGIPTVVITAYVPPAASLTLNDFLAGLDESKIMAFAELRTTFVESFMKRRDILQQNEIDNVLRLSYFLAMVSYETGDFKYMTENLNFSAERLILVFPRRFTRKTAAEVAGNPELIANILYAGLFGNHEASSGDGWRYRGRGYVNLTGRANYRMAGKAIGVDLEAAPELMIEPEVSMAVAAWYWRSRRLNQLADGNDFLEVMRALGYLAGPSHQFKARLVAAREALL